MQPAELQRPQTFGEISNLGACHLSSNHHNAGLQFEQQQLTAANAAADTATSERVQRN